MGNPILNSQARKIILVPAAVLVVSLLIGSLAVWNAYRTVTRNQRLHYESVRDLKADAITDWYSERQADISMLVQSEHVISLCQKLSDLEVANEIQDDEPYNITDPDYLKLWDRVSFLDDFRQAYGYYDVFIIDADHGHVQYTAIRESDLGTDLTAGPLKDSNIAECWRTVCLTKETHLTDFERYEPSGNEPAQFIGAPLIYNGTMQAVVILQIPLNQLNEIMHIRAGMGDTGETVLVGADYLLRCDSWHELQAGQPNTVLSLKAETEQVRRGLEGQQGFLVGHGYDGIPLLAAYGQVDLLGQKYAIVSEIHKSEAYQPVRQLAVVIAVIEVLLVIFVIWLASVYSKLRAANSDLDCANEELQSAGQELSEANAQLQEEIAERINVESEVRASEARLQSIIDNSADAIITITLDGQIRSFSPAGEYIFGYSAEEVIGQHVSILMLGTGVSRINEFLSKYIESAGKIQHPRNREIRGVRKDGKQCTLLLALSETILDGKRAFIGILKDITDRKAAEALALQQKELEAIQITAATHAHEINNPLTGIGGVLQVLSQKNLDTDVREMVIDAMAAVKRIRDVILKMEKMSTPRHRPYVGGRKILDLREAEPEADEE